MGKSSPTPPAPVVVQASAAAEDQAAFNKEAALQQRAINMIDQYTPDGSIKYEATGSEIEGIPQYKATQTLSDEQQRLYDLSNQAQTAYGEIGNAQLDKVRESFESPFSLESLGDAPEVNEATRQSTIDAIIARNAPQMQKDRDAHRTQLINSGFVEGSQAYDDMFDQINRKENDFRLAADVAGGNEMARMHGLETNQRDRAINEILMQRNQPLSELSSFMSGSAPTSPNFVPTPQQQVAAPDYLGAAYASADQQNAANMNVYNQQMASRSSNLQGLYGLGGAGLGAAGFAWGGRDRG